MKNYKIGLLLLVVMFSLNSFSQQKGKRQVVYAELLGSGGIGSVNYDFRFKPGNDGLGMRGGISYLPMATLIPLEVNGLITSVRLLISLDIKVPKILRVPKVLKVPNNLG